MTPRLKFLTAGLVLSILFAVNDYFQRQKDSQEERPVQQTVKTQPKIKRENQDRIKRISEKSATLTKSNTRNGSNAQTKDLLPIPESVATLSGWNRNPFIEEKTQILTPLDNETGKTKQTPNISELDNLNITSVAKMGNKVFVIINGQRFQEGDFINNVLIESIESQKITFKLGKTRIIKDVGT